MINSAPDLKSYLVTGGTGFIGSALVRRLIKDGHRVRVMDNNSRGSAERLKDVSGNFDYVEGDVRDAATVERAIRGVDAVFHLASVNGTEFFYTKPELVLEVCVKGIMNVLDACLKHNVPELLLASTSEVYQTPPVLPTDETVPLSIPDPHNPRYSYAGGKIVSELLAINYGRTRLKRVLIFRPHNVYGPNMGWEHVLPEFILRMKKCCDKDDTPTVRFPIRGSGKETRSFIFIDDFIDGLILISKHGDHLGIYNIGTTEEISMADVARVVGGYFGRQLEVVPGTPALGGTPRRCPDIAKLAALGFKPKFTLNTGVPIVAEWYCSNVHRAPDKSESDPGRKG